MRENQDDGLPDVYPEGVTYVWVIDEGVRARVISMGAYVTTVLYTVNGIDYEVMLENDEFYVMEEVVDFGPVVDFNCGLGQYAKDGND